MERDQAGVLGRRVLRVEDERLLTVGGTYVDDVRVPELTRAARVTFVRSPCAHALITGIDASAALAEPGVVAVLTAARAWKKPPPGPKSFQTRSERPRGGDGTVPGPGLATRAEAPGAGGRAWAHERQHQDRGHRRRNRRGERGLSPGPPGRVGDHRGRRSRRNGHRRRRGDYLSVGRPGG